MIPKIEGGGGIPPKNVRCVEVEEWGENNMGLENVPRCQHVKMNGTQCGSPALRRRRHCFFHDRVRQERAKIAAQASGQRGFDLPLLEDANSVQVALMKVIQMLGCRQMDHKTAGLILYALQTASVNLRNAEFEAEEVTDVVIDRDDVHRTSINGPQWFEEDFEDDAEEDEENEADGENIPGGLQANAEPSAKQSAKSEVKHPAWRRRESRCRGSSATGWRKR
jgi:hypothetical protein